MVEFDVMKSQMDDLQQKSVYHGGLTKILRLDTYFREADYHRTRLNLPEWKRKLDSIWIELRMFAKPESRKQYEELKISGVIPKMEAYTKANTPMQKNEAIDAAYKILLDLELFMKDLSFHAGLETPLASDPRYSFGMGKRG